MSFNIGLPERFLRIVVASLLLYRGLTVYPDSLHGAGLAIAAAMLALTGILGFCGFYKLLGISTRKPEPRPHGRSALCSQAR